MCPGVSTCCWTGPPPLVPRGCGSRERSEVGAAQSSEGSAAPDLLVPTHLVSLGACGSSKALQQRRLSIRGVSGNTEVTCTESCARPLLPPPAARPRPMGLWGCGQRVQHRHRMPLLGQPLTRSPTPPRRPCGPGTPGSPILPFRPYRQGPSLSAPTREPSPTRLPTGAHWVQILPPTSPT